MSRYTSAFSYYGGKSKLAHLYPKPQYPLIIEPFAGAAAYSLRYCDRKVWINDLHENTVAIWRLLQSPDVTELIDTLPNTVTRGTNILELGVDKRLVPLLRAQCNHGTAGKDAARKIVTPFGANGWHRLKPKVRYWAPRIKHWKVTQLDYRQLPNVEATWFVDPPYNNQAGKRYRCSDIDYVELAEWCKSRAGQVIVCENAGATWLPFKPITTRRRGVHSRCQRNETGEAMWCNAA